MRVAQAEQTGDDEGERQYPEKEPVRDAAGEDARGDAAVALERAERNRDGDVAFAGVFRLRGGDYGARAHAVDESRLFGSSVRNAVVGAPPILQLAQFRLSPEYVTLRGQGVSGALLVFFTPVIANRHSSPWQTR